MVVQKQVVNLEDLQEKMSTRPSTPPSCCGSSKDRNKTKILDLYHLTSDIIVFLFFELSINGIMQYALFCVWLLLRDLSMSYISSVSFTFIADYYPL